MCWTLALFFFFFQAEDGIRDKLVTGVQTCALPISRELGGAIEHAIARLRPEYRTCILLRHVEGHSYEEIARILELPLGTVKTYIHRARNELRGYLEDRRE